MQFKTPPHPHLESTCLRFSIEGFLFSIRFINGDLVIRGFGYVMEVDTIICGYGYLFL